MQVKQSFAVIVTHVQETISDDKDKCFHIHVDTSPLHLKVSKLVTQVAMTVAFVSFPNTYSFIYSISTITSRCHTRALPVRILIRIVSLSVDNLPMVKCIDKYI